MYCTVLYYNAYSTKLSNAKSIKLSLSSHNFHVGLHLVQQITVGAECYCPFKYSFCSPRFYAIMLICRACLAAIHYWLELPDCFLYFPPL